VLVDTTLNIPILAPGLVQIRKDPRPEDTYSNNPRLKPLAINKLPVGCLGGAMNLDLERIPSLYPPPSVWCIAKKLAQFKRRGLEIELRD